MKTYEIDINIEPIDEDVTITGDDLTALKSCILPIAKQICKHKGYKSDFAYITTTISFNGEYYDHDEDEFDLTEI